MHGPAFRASCWGGLLGVSWLVGWPGFVFTALVAACWGLFRRATAVLDFLDWHRDNVFAITVGAFILTATLLYLGVLSSNPAPDAISAPLWAFIWWLGIPALYVAVDYAARFSRLAGPVIEHAEYLLTQGFLFMFGQANVELEEELLAIHEGEVVRVKSIRYAIGSLAIYTLDYGEGLSKEVLSADVRLPAEGDMDALAAFTKRTPPVEVKDKRRQVVPY